MTDLIMIELEQEEELETIHEYLFDRYDKLVVDLNNPSILKQDDNDKKFNIIDLINKMRITKMNGYLLKYLQEIYYCNENKQYNNIKDYYNNHIKEVIKCIYNEYKCGNSCTNCYRFIDILLKEIKIEKQKLDNQKKSEEKQKLDKQKKLEEKQKLDKQKKLEEENVKLKQELQKQSITKPKLDNNNKKKKKPISATIKRLVWNTNIGEQIGKSKCMCCNVTDITQMSFNCGHIIAEINGGETVVSNLKPICQNCNSSMGTKDMKEFIKTLK